MPDMSKDKRQPYGDGAFYQRSDGMWIGAVKGGWTERGTRRRITVSSRDKATAKRKLRDKIREIEQEGVTNVSARATVKSWADEWIIMEERALAPKAFNASRSALTKWVIPAIGHRRFELLTPADVRKVENAQRAAGRANTTQIRTHSVLMKMLKAARQEGYPVPARVLDVKPPGKNINDRKDIPVDQALGILQQAAYLPHGSRFVAALLEGLRQGEALGLTWERVDFEASTMTIDWQLQPLPYRIARDRSSGFRIPDGYEARRLQGALHLVRPKSKAGWRVIPMVPWMRSALLAWRDAAPDSPHGLVWPNADGSPRTAKADDAEWYALQSAAGIAHPGRTRIVDGKAAPAPYSTHEARHTTVTLLIEAKVDPAIITAIVGQSSLISRRAYEHVNHAPALEALAQVAKRLELG